MENKKMISFEASEELKEALRIAAFRNSMSISAYIREVLQNEVEDILKQEKIVESPTNNMLK